MTSQASKASSNKAKIPAIIAVALMWSIFFGLYYFNNVYVWGVSLCKETMTNSLKSPGSAKFWGIEKKKVLGVNYIRWYVDSQNGFSALVRTHFVCMPIEGTALIYTDSDGNTSDYNRYNDLFEEGLSEDAAINMQKENLDQSMNKLNSILGK